MVCILQTLVSIFVLAVKKYRRILNLFLLATFILFLIHYFFYFFEYFGFFTANHFRASAIIPFQLLSPTLIYLYFNSRIYRSINGVRELIRFFPVFIIAIVFFVPVVFSSYSEDYQIPFFNLYSHIYRVVFSLAVAFTYVMYAIKITNLFADYYDINGKNFLVRLLELPDKVGIIKPIVILHLFGSIWFILELFMSIFWGEPHKYIDFLIASTLLVLGMLLSYLIIKTPKKASDFTFYS